MKIQQGFVLWEVVVMLVLFPIVLSSVCAQSQALVEFKKIDQQLTSIVMAEYHIERP